MRRDRLETMVKGWFIGDFNPAALKTTACEVAIKHYAAGDYEAAHVHMIATEVTAIVVGQVRMGGRDWEAGDILTIAPSEATDFLALTDTITVVVKMPSAPDDKVVLSTKLAASPFE